MKKNPLIKLLAFFLTLALTACGSDGIAGPSIFNSGPSPTGTLFFIQLEAAGQNFMKYDVKSGDLTTLFAVPERGWLSHADVSPDGAQIVVSYAPPPAENEVQFGYSYLFVMPADGSVAPRPLLEKSDPEEIFFNPVWSPDGRIIYFSHVAPADEAESGSVTTLKRLDVATSEVNLVAENAIWPRISPDGTKVVYVTSDPVTLQNELYVADADGANATRLLTKDDFVAIDSPLFSPDGNNIYVSAVTDPNQASRPWFDRLLGVQTASAHSIPSDWWRLPVTGGIPQQITDVNDVGLYGAFDPDGRFMAYASLTGLFVMNPDGSELTPLLETTASSALSWLP